MSGLVSIIIPAYNRSQLIVETLESVRAQTYSPLEIFVVDDCSTDDTEAVVSIWKKEHFSAHITLLSLEKNVGKSAAVNKAIACSSGEYLMILDSDDLLFPDAIRYEVDFLKRFPDVGAVFGNAYVLRDNKKTKEPYGALFTHMEEFTDLQQVYGDLLLQCNAIVASTVLLRRDVMQRVGDLNPAQRYVHDWDYWIRISRKSRIGYINKQILYYRIQSPGSSSANRFGTFTETMDLLLDAKDKYSKTTLIKAIAWQIKYHCWLVYHDGNPFAMFKICSHGIISFFNLYFKRI
jgi:GT2 family glycosyltransferase